MMKAIQKTIRKHKYKYKHNEKDNEKEINTRVSHSYMQKTCDVAEKAILAEKICGKSA